MIGSGGISAPDFHAGHELWGGFGHEGIVMGRNGKKEEDYSMQQFITGIG